VKPTSKRATAFSWSYISSNSCSDIGLIASSHDVLSYSSAGSKSSNCAECNACDSIGQHLPGLRSSVRIPSSQKSQKSYSIAEHWAASQRDSQAAAVGAIQARQGPAEIAFALCELKFRISFGLLVYVQLFYVIIFTLMLSSNSGAQTGSRGKWWCPCRNTKSNLCYGHLRAPLMSARRILALGRQDGTATAVEERR